MLHRIGRRAPGDGTGQRADPQPVTANGGSTPTRWAAARLFYRPLLAAVAQLPGGIRLTAGRAGGWALGYSAGRRAPAHRRAGDGLRRPPSNAPCCRHTQLVRGRRPARRRAARIPPEPAGAGGLALVSEAADDAGWRSGWPAAGVQRVRGKPAAARAGLSRDAQTMPLAPSIAQALQARRRPRRAGIGMGGAVAPLALRRRELLRTALPTCWVGRISGRPARRSVPWQPVTGPPRWPSRSGRSRNSRPGRCPPGWRSGHGQVRRARDGLRERRRRDVRAVRCPARMGRRDPGRARVAEELRGMLSGPGPITLPVDMTCGRGRRGPLIRTLACTWPITAGGRCPGAQALLRAEPVANTSRARRCLQHGGWSLPVGGIAGAAVRKYGGWKAGWKQNGCPGCRPGPAAETRPRRPRGRQWVVRLLQLELCAHEVTALRRTTRTLARWPPPGRGPGDRADVRALYQPGGSPRIEDAVMLVRGRASDVVPTSQPG